MQNSKFIMGQDLFFRERNKTYLDNGDNTLWSRLFS
ncbi:MAG: hypothetical protein ACI86M_002181, partial [Saprospiraceae bacterium]